MLEPKPNFKNEETKEFKKSINHINFKKMKKYIFILLFAMAGLMFAGVQSVNAQQNYGLYVAWNDDNCQCNEPYYGFVMVFVINTETNDTIINEPWTRDDITPHYFSGSAPIVTDCYCYSVNAAVYYQDGSVCCQGTKIETWWGQWLIDCNKTITVYMN